MSEPIKATELKQSRASKIQIEVRDITRQTGREKVVSRLNADADGDDSRNE